MTLIHAASPPVLFFGLLLGGCGAGPSTASQTMPAIPGWVDSTPELCVVRKQGTSRPMNPDSAVDARQSKGELKRRLGSLLRQWALDYRNRGGITDAEFSHEKSVSDSIREFKTTEGTPPEAVREFRRAGHSYRLFCLQSDTVTAAIDRMKPLTSMQREEYVRRAGMAFRALEHTFLDLRTEKNRRP